MPTDVASTKRGMATCTYWIRCGLIVVTVLIFMLSGVYVLQFKGVRKPSVYRFPFPAQKPLTEKDALDLSRQAMLLDGKRSGVMHPVLSGHKDTDGREVFFCRKGRNSDEGWVLWWLERPDYEWEYSVGIAREGDEVVCTISKPW